MSLMNLGFPNKKELESMMQGDPEKPFVSDKDRQRWGTLKDPKERGMGGKVAEEMVKPGMDMMSRPMQAQMQAGFHDQYRRESDRELAQNELKAKQQQEQNKPQQLGDEGRSELKQVEPEPAAQQEETASQRMYRQAGERVDKKVSESVDFDPYSEENFPREAVFGD